ncbi:MAG: COX15/CtaA family protein [Pseudomonadota bacterium]
MKGREATQFNHRTLAYLLWFAAVGCALAFRRSSLAAPFAWLAGLVTAQAGWGIYTLVSAAPMGLALVHQGLGVIVFLAAVRLAWHASYSPEAETLAPAEPVNGVVSTKTA